MKKEVKRLLSTTLFFALLLVALWGCTLLLEDRTPAKTNRTFFDSKTNYDVIFMGTSHVWNGILPMELWKEYGISSFNWGYSNSTPAQNYYLLKEIVKYTDPKVVVLDINGVIEYQELGNGKYKNDTIMSSHVQFDEFPLSINKIEAVYDLFDDYDGRNDFLWDFIMYHNRWDSLSSEDFDYELSTEKGAEYQTGWTSSGINLIDPNEKFENLEDYTCFQYLIKTLEFCQEKNIPVLCVCLPHMMSEDSMRVANTIGDVINSYEGCAYLNLLYSDIINFSVDINIDGGHVNYAGARKTTSFLGNILKTSFPLDDYSQNEYWIEDYEKYHAYKISKLKEQDNLLNYLMLLYKTDIDYSLEIYNEEVIYDYIIGSMIFLNELQYTLETPPVEGTAAHILIKNPDGSIADDVYFSYSDGNYIRTNI